MGFVETMKQNTNKVCKFLPICGKELLGSGLSLPASGSCLLFTHYYSCLCYPGPDLAHRD